jgi:hypothetical protein
MKNWIIYTLANPRTTEVRYVGWTGRSPERRLEEHIRAALRLEHTFKDRWVLSLLSAGLAPVIEVIDSGSGDGWAEAEKRWIAFYRASGARLANGTEGGDGVVGLTAEKLSARAYKQWANRTPEQVRAMVAKIQVRKASTATARRSVTFEQRSAGARARWAKATADDRLQWGKMMNDPLSPEKRSAAGKKSRLNQTPEQRTALARMAGKKGAEARWDGTTSEQRIAIAKQAWAKRTPEARSAFSRRPKSTEGTARS